MLTTTIVEVEDLAAAYTRDYIERKRINPTIAVDSFVVFMPPPKASIRTTRFDLSCFPSPITSCYSYKFVRVDKRRKSLMAAPLFFACCRSNF